MSEAEEEAAEAAREVGELVAHCGQGDRAALRTFFDRFAEDIYNFPIKVFHLDQDAGSDFFLYAFERLKDGGRFRSFQGRSSFRTWFYTVLRNLVIDWMRTIREVDTVNVSRSDERGNEVRSIELAPDPRSLGDDEDPLPAELGERLGGLPIELRIVFKLSFIYYMELQDDELQYALSRSGLSQTDLLRQLADLRHELSERELKNLGAEDKITSLYLSIRDLKQKRDRLLSQADTERGNDAGELERIERSIGKKYAQRDRLLLRKGRGRFIVRTPYKLIGQLLKLPEGSVSVQMMRTLERLRGGRAAIQGA
ncbi:MAG: sigma-70 family RNA polymerase sigma factor [Leptospirales bacterium]|nr:sigma-70 family RNA polymerase sigma factor [Leptospirales bacterium]